jgi:hypothetical protein
MSDPGITPRAATVTVTGYTAAKMNEISNETVVGGAVVADNLVLTRRDGQQINAGNVRGAKGEKGDTGAVGPNPNPTGTFILGGWAQAPDGYLLLEGQRILGGKITYPDLALIFPNWVDGQDLLMPNATNAVPLASSSPPGLVSGSMTHALNVDQLPAHRVTTPSHNHAGAANNAGSHQHNLVGGTSQSGLHFHLPDDSYQLWIRPGDDSSGARLQLAAVGGAYSERLNWKQWSGDGNHTHTISGTAETGGDHGHTLVINGSGDLVSNEIGKNAQINHTPRNITVKMAVKT